ncbi:hypothetical protein Tco_0885241 [Tanacetum coccineum]
MSGNPTPISEPETKSSSSSPTLISPEESDLIWEEFEAYLASDSFPLGNSNPSSLLPPFHNSLSGSTTSSSPSLHISETSDYFLEEFADELALDYSSPPLWDEYDDNLLNHETFNDDIYDDPFDTKEEKIKDSKILIDELDLPGSSDFFPFPECDTVFYEDFFKVDALPSTNNEDKVFNPGILIHENLFEVTNCATPEKNVKKATNASLILEDFNPPLYELPFQKKFPGSELYSRFRLKMRKQFSTPGFSLLKEFIPLFSQNYLIGALKLSKSPKLLKARWRFFLALTKRTSESWMFRVSTFIPLYKLKYRGIGSS